MVCCDSLRGWSEEVVVGKGLEFVAHVGSEQLGRYWWRGAWWFASMRMPCCMCMCVVWTICCSSRLGRLPVAGRGGRKLFMSVVVERCLEMKLFKRHFGCLVAPVRRAKAPRRSGDAQVHRLVWGVWLSRSGSGSLHSTTTGRCRRFGLGADASRERTRGDGPRLEAQRLEGGAKGHARSFLASMHRDRRRVYAVGFRCQCEQ